MMSKNKLTDKAETAQIFGCFRATALLAILRSFWPVDFGSRAEKEKTSKINTEKKADQVEDSANLETRIIRH